MSGVKRFTCAGLDGKNCRNQPEKTGLMTQRNGDSRKTRLRFYCRQCINEMKERNRETRRAD